MFDDPSIVNPHRTPIRTLLSASVLPPISQFRVPSNTTVDNPTLLPWKNWAMRSWFVVLVVSLDQNRLGHLGDCFVRDVLRSRSDRAADVFAVFLQSLEEVVQVVGQAKDGAAEFVLHALEGFQVVAAQGRQERLDLRDPLAHFLQVFILNVDEDFLAADEHRLGAGHLIVEPVPELNEVNAPAFGEEARLQKILPEVA